MTIHDSYPKTKRKIRQAFLALLEERSYAQISIRDIVDSLDLVRQTFYLHYPDKDTMLDEIITDLAGGLISLMHQVYQDTEEGFIQKLIKQEHPIFVEYFRYVRANADTFLVLLREDNGVDFHRRFSVHFDRYQDETFTRWVEEGRIPPEDRESKQKLYQMAVQNFVLVIFQWVQTGMQFTEEQMAAHHARMWLSYTEVQPMGEFDRDLLATLASGGTGQEKQK